jgi:hypothetical protein
MEARLLYIDSVGVKEIVALEKERRGEVLPLKRRKGRLNRICSIKGRDIASDV